MKIWSCFDQAQTLTLSQLHTAGSGAENCRGAAPPPSPPSTCCVPTRLERTENNAALKKIK